LETHLLSSLEQLEERIYNVGGVCICVRPVAGYFDLKFANSVQGWRKKWLYVKDEPTSTKQYGLAPFDLSQEILRRKPWDAEDRPEEMAAIESLIARIQALQNTQGEELSGVQIIVHFLRIRVQPLKARASPLWLYSGAGDATRISEDLSMKDLEKLVRRFTSLGKKSPVLSSCRVEPFSSTHALPTVSAFLEFCCFYFSGVFNISTILTRDFIVQGHQVFSSLPPTPVTRKKVLFATVNPWNLKRVRVHLIGFRSQCMPLTLPKQTPFLLRLP
jgi:hypothetical protein